MASSALVRLTASVASLRSADESLVALVKGLAQQIRDAVANGDSGALTALADSLDAETQTVVDAVNANSDVSIPDAPVEPTPAPAEIPAAPAPSDVETGQPQPALGDVSTGADVSGFGNHDMVESLAEQHDAALGNDLGVEPAAQPAPDVSTDQSSGATPDAPSA